MPEEANRLSNLPGEMSFLTLELAAAMTTITLSGSPEDAGRLQMRLAEAQEFLIAAENGAQTFLPNEIKKAEYTQMLLQELLKNGKIDIAAMRVQMDNTKRGDFADKVYDEACRDILEFCNPSAVASEE